MNVLFEIIVICSFFGLLTGLLSSLFLSKQENTWFTLINTMIGATIGFWYAIIWMFFTGGTEFNPLMIFGDILTVVILMLIFVPMIQEMQRHFIPSPKKIQTLFSMIVIVGISVFLLFSFMPLYSSATGETITTSIENVKIKPVIVDEDMMDELLQMDTDSSLIPVEMEFKKASLDFPWFTASPDVGQSLGFDVTFNVGTSGGTWSKPYVKIIIVHDNDDSGTITEGDSLWSPQAVKIVTNNCDWRSTVVYQSGSPWYQLHYAQSGNEILYFPVFHAGSLTNWMNDAGKTFPSNTPDGYTAPKDQLSWDYSGDTITLKEDISSFSSVSTGGSTTLKGEVYCADAYTGTNFIWVGAYDLNYQSNPFNTGLGDPLTYKTETFTVNDGGNGPTPPPDEPDVNIDIYSYVIGGALSIGCLGAIVYGRRFL